MLNNEENQKIIDIDSVKFYLVHGKAPSPFWLKKSFISSLINKLANLPPANKVEFIQIIDSGIQAAKNEMATLPEEKKNSVKLRIEQFKISIAGNIASGWKSKLHNDKLLPVEKIHWQAISYDNGASRTVEPTNSTRFFRAQRNNEYSQLLQGTSFLTNREALVGTQNMHVLDAAYSAYLLDDERRPYAALLALGDGCGGHFGEKEQDRAISRTAYFSCKQALRLMATFSTPEQCLANISQIIEVLKKEIRIKTKDFHEGSTLLAVRTFPAENGMHRLVGFNIGDSLLAGYDFSTHQLENLSPAHVQILELSRSEATANFPTSYQNEEIRVIDQIVSPSMHLIAMSDGIYDYLPTTLQTGNYNNSAHYQATFLDHETLNAQLNAVENAQQLHDALFNLSVTRLETERQTKFTEATEAKIMLEEKQSEFNQRFAEISQRLKQLEDTDDSQEKETEIAQLKLQQKTIREQWEDLQTKQIIQLGDDVTLIGLSLSDSTFQITSQNSVFHAPTSLSCGIL